MAGIDLATTAGITVLDAERVLLCRSVTFSGETKGLLYRSCRKAIFAVFEMYKVKECAVEQPLRTDIKIPGKPNEDGSPGEPTSPSMSTFQHVYGLHAIVEEACAALGVRHRYVHQGTWRKAFTGNGNADKAQSLAVAKLIDPSITSLDAAESMGVAWWLRGELNPKYAAAHDDLFAQKLEPKKRTPF